MQPVISVSVIVSRKSTGWLPEKSVMKIRLQTIALDNTFRALADTE